MGTRAKQYAREDRLGRDRCSARTPGRLQLLLLEGLLLEDAHGDAATPWQAALVHDVSDVSAGTWCWEQVPMCSAIESRTMQGLG